MSMTTIVPGDPASTAVVVYANHEETQRACDVGPIEVLHVPLIGWSVTNGNAKPILGVSRYEGREVKAVLITMSNGVIWDAVYNDNYPDLTSALDRVFSRMGWPKRGIGSPEIAKAFAAHKAALEALVADHKRRREENDNGPARTLN